ncbi:hypothetical protein MNEG_13569 [Monoraphidium neglectum]|uniref:Uncharacterized protein n=1 Tax=Monoraphidium neglectum TaxID=145388 RepID=A0A0D2KEU6_9CHLO|nr:hypothetical protein MNEG_13569 [Monoraphidium neglectum]KIY94393.1 hypothetical protein MNEG_13569 [Monoraphidium neglectum]|eukprot:XP_013893413.1 hypothetical protein MNEG_13569 [Monoraphidium neglectum]
MPLTYSIAYGVIAGCCSYLTLYLANLALDLGAVALGRAGLRNVLYDACPEAFQDKLTPPPPFHSPSAVLQDHVNPEHAAHFAALEGKSPDAAALDDKARGLPTHDTKTTDSKP